MEPNSYRDPFWTDLAASTEQKLGLPGGLLVSVLTKGERSNANQVSEAGAKTPFQIIPATRVAAVKKYGIDPYLSAQNAAEVAGLLLKDSLKRNGDDPALAVAEYHGGTNRDNWGPRTKAYVSRVLDGAQSFAVPDPAPVAATDLPLTTAPSGPSTFDRLMEKMGKPPESAMSGVFNAYKSGQMSPADAQQFEADVRAGHVMLPRGESLKPVGSTQSMQGANVLPAGVLAAYSDGRMPAADKAQLEADVRSGAVSLPPGTELGGGVARAAIPGQATNVPAAPQPAPSLADRAIGTGEAALSAVTGATGGSLGMLGGALKGLAEQILSGKFGTPEAANMVEQSAAEGAHAMTYQPRTAQGQQQSAVVGDVMQQLIPVMGAAPGLRMPEGSITAPLGAAKTAAAAVLDKAATAVPQAMRDLPGKIAAAVRPGEAAATPGTMGSVGAAGTDMALQRTAAADSLPVPVKLTSGQATRNFEQLRFEKETAKDPSRGAPLRNFGEQQNADLLANFDRFVDLTGAEAPDVVAAGRSVTGALAKSAAADKSRTRAAYKAAEKAGELEAPVTLTSVVDHLNDSAPDAATAPILTTARARALQLGVAEEAADGQLVPRPVTLKTAETFRQAINRATDFEPTNIRQSAIIKGAVDESTAGLGGDLYSKARALRSDYAAKYENHAIIADLINNRRGMSDPKVAVDKVFQRSIMQGSPDDVIFLRRRLMAGGEDGKQAWREMQGATLQHIREQATRGVTTDQRGNPVISPAGLEGAIKALDKNRRLEIIFGKRGAQQLRDMNDIAKVINTAPPGAINTSNTASVLLAALTEAGVTGSMTGIPIPLMSGLRAIAMQVKDRRIQQRVQAALRNEATRQLQVSPKVAPNNKPATPIGNTNQGARP